MGSDYKNNFLMKRPYIIAEIGVNHNGNFDLAKKTIKAAAKSGADAVKFQMFHAEEFMSNINEIYKYKTAKGFKKEDMFKMFKRLEFPYNWHEKIKKCCKNNGVDFFSTAGSEITASFLAKKKIKFIKIASPDLTNYPLIEHIAKLKRKIILSTGMASEEEIDTAVNILKSKKATFVLLHCVSMYPTKLEDANLLRIVKLKKKYKNVEIGYSDHTLGIESAVIATALGATVIEKHFTLNKNLVGPDHLISSDPKEFTLMVNKVRNTIRLMGRESIEPNRTEKKNRKLFRRSITVLKSIKKKEKLSQINLCLKRPETGLHPKYLKKILNKKAKKFLKKEHKIKFRDFN